MTVRLVRMQAKEMASVFWDSDRSERFRAFFPDRKEFVGRFWPDFVQGARSLLIDMLGNKMVAQHIKDEIEDAIIEDTKRAANKPILPTSHRLLLKPDEPGKIEQKATALLADL